MLKTVQSPSLPIAGLLLFDLFEIRHSEPFIVMYGFSSGYGYQLEGWQKKLVHKTLHNRMVFEKWQAIGTECKAGTRPLPEWVRNAAVGS